MGRAKAAPVRSEGTGGMESRYCGRRHTINPRTADHAKEGIEAMSDTDTREIWEEEEATAAPEFGRATRSAIESRRRAARDAPR